MRLTCLLFLLAVTTQASAQQQGPAIAPNDGKVRVFVNDSQSWEVMGGWGYSSRK